MMKKKPDNLKEAIYLLEKKQTMELNLLKEQFTVVKESLKPINLIKNIFNQVTTSPEIKGNLIDNVIGLTSGYFSKKLFVGGSHNPITKIIGTLLQFGISNVTSKNTDTIRSVGEKVVQFVMEKFNKNKEKESEQDYSVRNN